MDIISIYESFNLFQKFQLQQPAPHASHTQVQSHQYIQQIQTYNPQLHVVQHMQQPGQQQQLHQHGDRSTNAHRPDGSGNQGVFDIPIFTEEFLDHNKGKSSVEILCFFVDCFLC